MTKPPNSRGERKRLGEALRDIAPELAQAVGGPFAAAAIRVLNQTIFGREDADENELADAVFGGDPSIRLAIRQAELVYRGQILDAELRLQEIAANDRDSARRRQVAMRDRAPTLLGLAIVAGFFGILIVMMEGRIPSGAEVEFSIMLGALATMTAAVVNYFFGSSAGSREKTRLMTTPEQARRL